MELTLDVIKGLRLYQPRRGYRFSLDALLLEDFVRPPRAERIADLGAGVGIVGLLLARRYRRARVLLVELQPPLAELARKNVALSGLSRRVQVLQADVREPKGLGEAGGFDLVVSNPPYRRPGAGRLSPTEQRAVARHELALSLQELLRAAAYLLRNKGRFFLVHHPERLGGCFWASGPMGLSPSASGRCTEGPT